MVATNPILYDAFKNRFSIYLSRCSQIDIQFHTTHSKLDSQFTEILSKVPLNTSNTETKKTIKFFMPCFKRLHRTVVNVRYE